MRHIPKAYERYRHFKGNEYQILAIARHSEDGTEQVVYQALYPPFTISVRPLSMFMSEVDRGKYPSAAQRYRFELISEGETAPCAGMAELGIARATETSLNAGVKESERITPETVSEQTIPETAPEQAMETVRERAPEQTISETAPEQAMETVRERAPERTTPETAPEQAMETVREQAPEQMASESVPGQTSEEAEEEWAIDKNVLAFLDADTYEQKLSIFSAMHDKVTQDMLNTIAASLDIEVDSGDLEERYRQIQNCLMTFQRYECNRLR